METTGSDKLEVFIDQDGRELEVIFDQNPDRDGRFVYIDREHWPRATEIEIFEDLD